MFPDTAKWNIPCVLACVLRGVPCVEYSRLDRDTTILLPVPGPTFPNRTGQIQLLDDVSFSVHAAIANFAGAQLYNIVPGSYEQYVVSKYGNGWMVVDTENEKITEANAWLIARAIMADHDGWENGEFWKGEKWLPITFWSNEIENEEHLAALVYLWGNDVDVLDDSGECHFHFAHKHWSVNISENMGLMDIRQVEQEMMKLPYQNRGVVMDLNTKKLFSGEFEQRLQILTDLSPKDVQLLHEICEGLPLTAHPSTRNSLKRDRFD